VSGVSPEPAGAATHTGTEGGAAGSVCPGAVDEDADGWHAAVSGGHDCDDSNERIDGCFDGNIGGDCLEPQLETCNGQDDDCDGWVDDPFLVLKTGGASVLAVGALFSGGSPALVVGEAGVGAADGSVALYRMSGNLVVRIVGTGLSASFGTQLATGRDLTGDGVDDLVVSAPYATNGDGPNSGVVTVFAGPIDERTTLDDAVGWFDGGELDGQPGGQLALAPDLTGDGLAELVIGYYRHTVLFSGAPGPGARLSDAASVVEMNTGGGSWQYASGPDTDGDGRAELLLGMSTYDGGLGVVAEVRSSDPSRVAGLTTAAAWRGLGAGLVTVDGVVWALSGETPVRLDTLAAAPALGNRLANGGDLDGDGHDDLLVGDDTAFAAPFLGLTSLPGALQSDRSLAGATDVDDDGASDPRVLVAGETAALVSGALAFSLCDADGDGVSAAAGDCDDDDAQRSPLALEGCNGVDDDCDGIVDSPAQVAFEWPRAGGVQGVVLLGAGDAAVLGEDGQVDGTGAWAGTVVVGLTAIAYGGGLDGSGAAVLLGRQQGADVLLPQGAFGAADFVATARVADGVGLARSGAFGTIGDFDGDGIADMATQAVDPVSHLAVVLFEGPVVGEHTLDEAGWRFDLPDGWGEMTLGLAAGADPADVTADGLADLLLASGSSYYGQGRLLVLSGVAPGVTDAEAAALLNIYGEPDEAMGTTLAVGGDVTGDGVGDALVGGAYGTRILVGGDCPSLGPGWEAPSGSLAMVDLDEDRLAEPLSVGEETLWWRGEAWRSATRIWSAGPLGIVVESEAGAWHSLGTCE
jgi:hypothetical protein